MDSMICTLRRHWWLILGVAAALTIWGVALTSIQVHESVEGVYSIETDTWSPDIFTPPAQRQLTVALALRGVDYIRLWPLPPMHPWSEDGGQWEIEGMEMAFAALFGHE
jgi:hypothetical protein